MGLLRRTTSGLKLNVNLRMLLSTVTTYSEQSDDELWYLKLAFSNALRPKILRQIEK